MTISDILAEVPTIPDTHDGAVTWSNDPLYSGTCDIRWFVGCLSPIHDERRVLAQRYISPMVGFDDVWVAVQETVLDKEECRTKNEEKSCQR